MGALLDLCMFVGFLAFAAIDWRRWRRGTEQRPWWRLWLALAALSLAFLVFAPGGVSHHL